MKPPPPRHNGDLSRPGDRWLAAAIRTALVLAALPARGAAVAATYVDIPAGDFVSALAVDGTRARVSMAAFSMRTEPVTNGDYLAFVQANPEWRRGSVSALFAGPHYLESWETPLAPGAPAPADHPVTNVSWFAARAYCLTEQARLPNWYEWEYVAAADASQRDARSNPQRNQDVLTAILGSSGASPGPIGQCSANVYGVRDINRLLWEWTGDIAAMFPNADARAPGAGPDLALCGGSALAFSDKNDYALMMRVASLAALKPTDDAARVGFRCVRDLPGG